MKKENLKLVLRFHYPDTDLTFEPPHTYAREMTSTVVAEAAYCSVSPFFLFYVSIEHLGLVWTIARSGGQRFYNEECVVYSRFRRSGKNRVLSVPAV